MSWDLLLLPAPADVTSVDELPDDFRSDPLGSRAQIAAAMREWIPGTDLTDPAWGHLAGPAWSVEVNIGSDDPVESIMLHVRGTSNDALPAVFRIADAVGCRVLDISEGTFLTSHDGATSWHAFQDYRDHVIREA
ncbi:hypothetical protein ACIRPK_24235 [Kitasatospora sp. NPDC101801]|uniref:hypothetical protein n=1 Tax=Kitasatospora sp. NPDC101801 TaxID=3364103 RepID=UPI003820B9E9